MNSPKPNSFIAPCLFALTVKNVLVSEDTVGCQEDWQDIPSELFGCNKKAVTGNQNGVYYQVTVRFAAVVLAVCEFSHVYAFPMCRNRDEPRRVSVTRCWVQQKPCTAAVLAKQPPAWGVYR